MRESYTLFYSIAQEGSYSPSWLIGRKYPKISKNKSIQS